MKLVARVHVEGMEHLNIPGAFIGVTNHLSSFDPMLVIGVMPRRRFSIFAAIEHRHDFVVGWALDRLGAIWIDRDQPSREALRIALNELAHGAIFGIAPEGTRSQTGGLVEGKTGVAYLATRANVPIVPGALWGTEMIKHNLRRLKRTEVHIHVGEPIHLPQGRANTEQLQAYTDLVMHRLAEMLPVKYRGVYRDAVK
jgi:1-acyl-sn-glycerol-3-phosphate acyltransferase